MFALFLVLGLSNANAQDDNNPWQISFGINAVDFWPTGEDAPLGDYFDEYFNVTDHYNIIPSLSVLSASKYLGNGFSFGATGSVNKIEKFGDQDLDDLIVAVGSGNKDIKTFETSVFSGSYITNDIDNDYLEQLDAARNNDTKETSDKEADSIIDLHNEGAE